MEIYLVRHTAVNVDKNTCYGQLNVPINHLSFKKDFELIQNKLPANIDSFFSSPLERCKILAEKLGKENIIFDNDLLEINFGQWEGKKWSEINQTDLNFWMNDFVTVKPPEGENLLELYSRISNFIDNLRTSTENTDKKIIIITHSGVIRCFYAYFLGIPLKNLFKIFVGFNEVHHFKLSTKKETDLLLGKL
ncbi:MAG: alpha-ribazole phosphatase family protein [Solirubrobacteraceae bacterium]